MDPRRTGRLWEFDGAFLKAVPILGIKRKGEVKFIGAAYRDWRI